MTPHVLRPARVVPRASIALVLLCTGFCWQQARGNDPEAIAWRDNYDLALNEARAQNRLLWVQFTGPWCPNCVRMEHDSFPHPAIVHYGRESFVPLKLRSDVNGQLVQGFNLSALPATVIVAPNRDVVALHQGYLGPDDLVAFLRDSLTRQPRPGEAGGSSAEDNGTSPAGRAGAIDRSKERLALAGYCPVSLVCDRKLVVGKAEYKVCHEGRCYRFASAELSARFRKEPQRFVPANDGCCPVTRVQQGVARTGDPKWGVLCAGRLFLCATEEDRRAFLEDPQSYAVVGVAESGYCVHCIRESGVLVPGDPQHEVAREGLRYWFPDATHRDAFLASLN
jgi:YHS domain-containing protein